MIQIPRFTRRQSTRSNARQSRWSLTGLEQRIMLAGDVAHAATQIADVPAEVTASLPSDVATVNRSCRSANLVFIDSAVDDLDQVVAGVIEGADIVLLSEHSSGLDQISKVLSLRTGVQSVHLIAHGDAGQIALGNEVVTEATLVDHQQQLRNWSRSLSKNADVLLYSCRTGRGAIGEQFVQRFSRLTGADVAASIDTTGASAQRGDWDLELNIGQIDANLVVTDSFRSAYHATLPITIRAAGVTNQETMELQIGGTTVATFHNVGGDAYGGQFETFTYDVDGIDANQVRIAFTNDLFDSENNIDRNLRVDRINIDGTNYQTEAPSVFSTGTWRAADGITPGFRESEFLHGDGYFQYASSNNTGSTIDVRALGEEGTEQFDLQIDGQTVASFDATESFATYSYQASGTVQADQVRVVFTNDQYDPANNIDSNLRVNDIQIDGQRYQTEAPTVFSTGTWLPEDGIQPGFRESETLHTNGYFQYDAQSSGEAGTISLTINTVSVDELSGSRVFVIFRSGGTQGSVSVDYTTRSGSADVSDYAPISGTAVFEDGQSDFFVNVEITNDNEPEPDETFFFEISNPAGGATLGGITSQRVTIRNNDGDSTGIVFQDSFEGSNRWTVDPFGTDTASRGQWEVGAPQQTSAGGILMQIGSGNTGPRALVTGLAAGSRVAAFDVDNGITSALSPEIRLPNGIDSELRFHYNFAHTSSATSDDFLTLSVVTEDGQIHSLFGEQGDGSVANGNYHPVTESLGRFDGQTIRLLFQANDSSGTILEAAIDDIVVETVSANAGTVTVASSVINVDEASGTVSIDVQRSGGRDGVVTVDYITIFDTADNTDFVPENGTITFEDQQTTATIAISILNDTEVESLETFQVALVSSTGGVDIGRQNVVTVNILDDDAAGTGDFRPDLIAMESRLGRDLSIDNSEISGRSLLRFSTEVANQGAGPLEIWGGQTSGNTQEVFQRIYNADGSRDRLAGDFVFHDSHGHVHFEGFANYSLLDINNDDIVATGGKTSFCLINIRQPFSDATANADRVHGRGGNSCGQIQGISVGYSDIYSASLPDQWIDITDVADGTYWLSMTTDPDDVIQETDETNNDARIRIIINNGSVSVV